METTAVRDGDDWVINGEKTWNTGIHKAQYDLIFARTSGNAGDGHGITAFLDADRRPRVQGRGVPVDVQHADRPRPHLAHRRAGAATRRSSAVRAAASASSSTSSTRTASARRPSSLGAAQFCINESVAYAKERKPFGKPLATNQAHPVPARRAADAVRDAAGADPQDGVADGHRGRVLAVGQGVDVQLLGQPAVLRGGRPGDAGARRARATRGTSRSSTSTATTAATASPRAPRRSRCGASPATCSAS